MSQYIADPSNVNLSDVSAADVVCFLELGSNEYDGRLGERVASIFVIFFVSTAVTFFPVVAKRVRWLKIPLYVYLFARYFGAGVIVATAFVHLLDPAYGEIGPNTCVGMTGNWAQYSWPPAIVLTSVTFVFLMNLISQRYVEMKYGDIMDENLEDIVTGRQHEVHDHGAAALSVSPDAIDATDIEAMRTAAAASHHHDSKDENTDKNAKVGSETDSASMAEKFEALERNTFRQQIAAFYILEFGVIFHSVVIGLNLGVVGQEFTTLFPVLVFHQSFEGLGIGARMSAIPFPKGSWMPWILCSAYGLTTPISIAIGLALKTTYNPNGYNANIIAGVFDSISAGILIYTGLVELLARDFIFDPLRCKDNKRLTYQVIFYLLGAGIMALVGKWA